jgi:hypothetical protein
MHPSRLHPSRLRPRICASIAAAALFILGHAATSVQAQTKAPPALTGTVTSAEEASPSVPVTRPGPSPFEARKSSRLRVTGLMLRY